MTNAAEDDELTRQAIEELTKSAQRGKERTKTMGALGWNAHGKPNINKAYLNNTIIGALQTNKRVVSDKRSLQTSSRKRRSSSTPNSHSRKSGKGAEANISKTFSNQKATGRSIKNEDGATQKEGQYNSRKRKSSCNKQTPESKQYR